MEIPYERKGEVTDAQMEMGDTTGNKAEIKTTAMNR